jgi:hypothetical protein
MEFERNESSTRILYGREPYRGVYLSVYDQRLSYKDEMPWDVKKAVKKFGSTADRSGAYFDLRTGTAKKNLKKSVIERTEF